MFIAGGVYTARDCFATLPMTIFVNHRKCHCEEATRGATACTELVKVKQIEDSKELICQGLVKIILSLKGARGMLKATSKNCHDLSAS
jgi:hypothetical protein